MVDEFVTIDSVTGHLPTLVETRITDIAGEAGGGGGTGTVTSVALVEPDVDGDIPRDDLRAALGTGEVVNVVAASGSTETLPPPPVLDHDITLTADCAITLPSGFDATESYLITVWLNQPSTGGSYTKSVTWVGGVDWLDGGTPPIVATGQGAVTVITFRTRDGGATWRGSASVVDPGNQGVTLTYGATVNTAAGEGDVFDLTLTGNAIMAAPTGLTKNKKILYRLTQDATGGRTVTWNAIFRFSTDVPTPFLSTSGTKTDYVGFIYNAADSKLDCLAVSRGY